MSLSQGRIMVAIETRTVKATPPARRPTEYLLRADTGQLSSVMIYRLTLQGFALKDVQDMLSMSLLYSTQKVISRIVGRSVRTIQRQGSSKQPAQLNAQQSAVAFQYAKVLEHATSVFGTQKLAEEWLGRPCKYLDGDVPLDVIDNPIGFQTVEDYLERVALGVYQ
jgi:putative toxin-antitoxin system antitoxin component (TIGR02293 family)